MATNLYSMLKKITHWLLLMLLVGPIYLFATPSIQSATTTSPNIYDNCPTIASDDLYTSNLTNTFTYIYCPRNIGAVRTQFRYRPIGTDNWQLTNITSTTFRFILNLEAGTTYEFQVSYECANGIWSDFRNLLLSQQQEKKR